MGAQCSGGGDGCGLEPCEQHCAQCPQYSGANADILAGDGKTQPKSLWLEEEVHMMGDDPMVNLSYGQLGMHHPGQEGVRSKEHLTKVAGPPPLYAPGGLVPLHELGEDGSSAGPPFRDIYRLDPAPIGRGTYGEVTAAEHRRTGARRAVKSIDKASLVRYVGDVGAFVRREVDILRKTDHPNIVRLYEAFEEETMVHLVLELLEGGDLLERVAVVRERMPERDAAMLLAQMLGAIQHLHLRGYVHRDLKPENFLFSRRESTREPLPPEVSPVKLIDFGLSRRLSFEATARMTPKIGTAEYMAPEAFSGRINAVLADRTDIWSIGVVLHVIFIGHFPSPHLHEQTPEEYLSRPCWKRVSCLGRDLLGQLLRYEPTQRPTVTATLRHPWITSAACVGQCPATLTMRFHGGTPSAAVRTFAAAPEFRRLALMAAAREVDDCEFSGLRRLFRALEAECDGSLTHPALQRVAWLQGPLGTVSAELVRAFEVIDADGSGTIDWTELVATALVQAGLPHPAGGGSDIGCGAGEGSPARGRKCRDMVAIRDEAIWRAFDLLGQGQGTVSSASR